MSLRAFLGFGLGVFVSSCSTKGEPDKTGATAQSATPNAQVSASPKGSGGPSPDLGKSVRLPVDPGQESNAIAAAEQWLLSVDEGRYADSYAGASEYFKEQGTQAGWIELVKKSRTPLGKVQSRTLKSKKVRTSVPGGPDGLYVTLRFETDFDNKMRVVETLAPVLESDGKWRVSGYYLDADNGQTRRPQ